MPNLYPEPRSTYLPFGRPEFGPAEEEAVLRVLRSGWVGMGAETIAFEQELAAYLGVPEVVTVSSCTAALHLSLLVNGVGPGDEVIVPSLTWCSTANAALYVGGTPVFCDVDPDTMCATWETIAPKLSERTRAVMVVHYGGLAADTRRIREHLPPHVALIEDAAHALGTRHSDGSLVGSHGTLTCFSLYANKNLSAGEGGAIALFDRSEAEHLRKLRLHALQTDAWKRFTSKQVFEIGLEELGYKMNWTDLQASIARVQLRRQEEFHVTRQAIVQRYREALPAILPGITWQVGFDGQGRHAAHLFVVKLPLEHMPLTRNELLLRMREQNVGASVHYAPLHTMPLYTRERPQAALPTIEWLAPRILTLPISASMGAEDVEDVLRALRTALTTDVVDLSPNAASTNPKGSTSDRTRFK